MMDFYRQFEVTRGNELDMRAELKDPQDGYTLHFYIMEDTSDTSTVYVEKHTGDGITQEGPVGYWTLDDADIALLEKNYYHYVWKVVYEDALGDEDTVGRGTLVVKTG